MADTYKVLGQSDPTAATLTAIYTVPAATEAVVSTFVVCNRSATPTTFRMSVAPLGAADANLHYQYFDRYIGANDTFAATFGITLAATDVVRVYATLATLSFSLHGVEVT